METTQKVSYFSINRISIFLVAGTFLLAAFYKIFDPEKFFNSLESYGIIPVPLFNFMLQALIVAELSIGICILFNLQRIPGLVCGLGMSILFLMYHIFALIKGITADCGCLPFTARLTPIHSFVFIFLLTTLTTIVYLNEKGKMKGNKAIRSIQ